MQYREYSVPPDLSPFAQTLWVVTGEVGQRIRVTPDACTDIIAPDDPNGALRFIGPMSIASVVPLRWRRTMGVRFRPGALALVRRGLALRMVRDRDLVISGIPSGDDPLAGVLTLVRALVAADALIRHPDVDRVLAAMMGDASPPLAPLYRGLGLEERAVQRLFDRYVGLTPKQTARILRQDRVTRILRAGTGNLATLASRFGYADQAHLTREFRAQIGLPPGRYRTEIRDVGFVQDTNAGTSDTETRQ